MHLAQELVAYVDRLATLPDVYLKVRAAMDDPDVSIAEVADVIATDPALTASLLRLANSAFYGYARKIESINRAVSLIGLEQVHDLVLATSVTAMFSGIRPQRMDMARFWRDSIRRGMLAREVARSKRGHSPERLFVAGLLADAGHLVMYVAVPDLMALVLDTTPSEGDTLPDVERRIIGCDFAEVGAALTAKWQLPVTFGVLIGSQLQPEAAGDSAEAAALLNLTSAVAARSGGASEYEYPLHHRSEALAGIEVADVEAVLPSVEAQMEMMQAVLATA
ncbi:HDOD domain-containing protein [Niveibacterium sp. 24ML]|uniref:HDOD domain-containing protein n=1 Tax=Niveibacterium sp. 24ML TaxID=2985512 RepID=UPI00226E424C|nr:HDOD domain-containing protein [Niveibacterium sp. 24ML]MCX9156114.1 HDOD domain-containing protein [Niveibacterium sp. 24ML]